MFKIPVTYITLDGETKSQDLYFNLTRAEAAKIHLSIPGGFDGFIARLENDPDWSIIDKVYKSIILTAYGKKTASGKFIKTEELTNEFFASDAYSEVFLMFLENKDGFINKFLNGALNVPREEIAKLAEAQGMNKVEEPAF